MRGRLKFVDRKTSKWGFILPDDGGSDAHFWQRDVIGGPLEGTKAGCELEFDLEPGQPNRRARRIRIVSSGEESPSPNESLREIAFYYPGHLWQHTDWIKTLLLFFDGVGLLVPEYKQGEPEELDPVLAAPLRDRGLLHYLIADQAVDKQATEELATALTHFIASGAFDSLARDGTEFHAISMSRMGYYGDRGLAEMLFEELESRGLARRSKDGVSIPLHPAVRHLILVLLAQILRPRGPAMGLDLWPATDQFRIVRALTEFLDLPEAPSAGRVVAFDLQAVSVNLSSVPLDEVLAFRSEHRAAHQKYARAVRGFARELSLMPEAERKAAFTDRQSEIEDLASDLRRNARRAWRQPASFALGLAGAAWTFSSGNPIGALLAAGALAVRGWGGTGREAGAFSYVFAAHARYA